VVLNCIISLGGFSQLHIYCAFDQINAALASIRDFFQKYITH